MKNKVYWLLILLASCATVNPSESDLIKEDFYEQPVGQYEFEKAKLNKESLKTFEPVAVEKFGELFEQLKIAANPSYDDNFKVEAETAINTMLIINDDAASGNSRDNSALTTYLGTHSNLHNEKLSKVLMNEPFQLVRQNVYKGEISFELSGNSAVNTIDTYLLKVLKSFGSEQEEIWEIKFDLL